MDAWNQIRIVARRCHADALEKSGGDRAGGALNTALLQKNDLQLSRRPSVDDGLFGFLDRPAFMVNIASNLSDEDEAVVIAHELGHFFLHKDPRNDVNHIDSGLGGDAVDSGANVVQGYSPLEQKEVQADVFAGEFLCPSDWLREELLSGRRPSEVAKELSVPTYLVTNQAIRSLLLPALEEPAPVDQRPNGEIVLDESQREAVEWEGGPLLLDAGPGTGKTRTLVSRIQTLLDGKVPAASILALTFSNKAAAEMRERVAENSAEEAIEMWLGTFHAFGLELIRKWSEYTGRSLDVKILDQTKSLALLENNLSLLDLHYYQNLYEPAYDLAEILKAISRCKDEMIAPDEYETQAMAYRGTATGDDIEAAEKTIEVARVYRVYEKLLLENDAVDYGDLVMKAVQILESNAEIRDHYHDCFEHVLVDEYQDVNLASARLLRALSGESTGVWVVADPRQSIYRFRGAEPANVSRFEAEFSGERRTLKYNYRSGEAVVRTFDAFASSMQNVSDGGWVAHRGATGGVTLTVAADVASEAAAIRESIEHYRKAGIPYDDQVVLGRSHLTLGRICGELEQLGVPLLYLGDLFERDEVRDLLSLVALDAEFGGIGLVRVATLPEYAATRCDALRVIRWAVAQDLSVFEALEQVDSIEGISESGQVGLAILGKHLEGMGPTTSPWTLLTTWLFERSNYLVPLLSRKDAKAQQCLIAIYQLLKVCGEHMAVDDPSCKRLVQRIRRIEKLNQDTPYRAVSSEASGMDAVRVMTIHGSKGLEFGAVHLPAVATRYMPSSRKGTRCPSPPSLAYLTIQKNDHEAEEECLFFVALSRARDFLSLSRAERYTTQKSSPSKFLERLREHLPRQNMAKTVPSKTTSVQLSPPGPLERYNYKSLETYFECPSRYSYENIDEMYGSTADSAYVGFHRCISETIGWLEDGRQSGSPHDVDAAKTHLAEQWEECGPVRHPNAAYYRGLAETAVAKMVQVIIREDVRYERAQWDVELNGRVISIVPDRVFVEGDDTIHVQRVRNSRPSKSESSKPVYALLRHGARQRFPGKNVIVETLYPASGETVPTDSKNDSKHLKGYADAIASIERGLFPANPNPRRCPSCPCYFICGS